MTAEHGRGDFRLGTVGGRTALEHEGRWVDVARLLEDEELADVNRALAQPARLSEAGRLCASADSLPIAEGVVGPCVPHPRQVFAIGLNYRAHAAEAGFPAPDAPMVFTKFPSCITGPGSRVALSGAQVDWEAEIVAVVGIGGRDIPGSRAWEHIAALTVGQDLSDRQVQTRDTPPQFSLGKSYRGYGPLASVAVGLASFEDPGDVGLWCDVDGERMQSGRTGDLFFSIPALVEALSATCELLPGDLIFTGTPAGVGMASGRYLRPGSVVTTGADVIGEFEIVLV